MGGFDTAVFIGGMLAFILGSAFSRGCQAFVAARLGDKTPVVERRTNFSPRRQHEPLGLFLSLFLTLGYPIVSWAKPLNLNLFNNRLGRRGGAVIALSGILAQIGLGLVIGFILYFAGGAGALSTNLFMRIAIWFVFYNFLFASFNLLPLPPLDGFGVVKHLLPSSWDPKLVWMEENGPVLVLIVIFLISFIFRGNPLFQFVFYPFATSLMRLVGLPLSL